jgi:Ca-activated chloride channel family protein
LNAPWVTSEQKEAATAFENFLLDRPQQLKAIELGFRPSDPSIPLTSPLDDQHGVDMSQPKTILEIPSAEVIAGVQNLWNETKKPVDLVVVMDTSGSMEGEKITAARNSLMKFINLLDDRDRLQVVIFNSNIYSLTELSEVGPKRQQVLTHVAGITEGGGTTLYDATIQSYQDLGKNGDPRHIRAVVLLTDGKDTESQSSLDDVISTVGVSGENAGSGIKLFTIAFGGDADKDVLKQIAESTGGLQYDSDPKTIEQVYQAIATFF